MIRGCAIILGAFSGVLPDFLVPFWAIPRFWGIDFDILLMTLRNGACRALVSSVRFNLFLKNGIQVYVPQKSMVPQNIHRY